MHIVYWAHSYRDEDASVNKHFGVLIEKAAGMVVNFDPPSKGVNSSKLERNLLVSDGMVAVLTWRANGPSQFILYEIGLALRGRKPLLVFLDDGVVLVLVQRQQFGFFLVNQMVNQSVVKGLAHVCLLHQCFGCKQHQVAKELANPFVPPNDEARAPNSS